MSMFANAKQKKVPKTKDKEERKKEKAAAALKQAAAAAAEDEPKAAAPDKAKSAKKEKKADEKKAEAEPKAAEAKTEAAKPKKERRKHEAGDGGGGGADEEAALAASDATQSAADARFALFAPAVYAAFGQLQAYARELNTSIGSPEVLFLGPAGDGKSALVDAVVGARLLTPRATLRPLHLTLVHNAECTGAPRITVKRDAALAEFDNDEVVSAADLLDVLDARMKEFNETPVHVLYESADVMNVTLIDLPGIDAKNAKSESLALQYMREDTSRRIVACEAAKDFGSVKMLELVKKCDPDLSRTTFVFTKFWQHLRTFADSRSLNRYLAQAYPDVPTFFVSLPSTRIDIDTPAQLRLRVLQALRRDMVMLEQLQHDKRHEKSFGAIAVRTRLLRGVWRSYQDAVPRVLKQLRARAATTDRELRAQQAQLQALDAAKLRSIASHYVVAFLQAVQRLLEGTSDANPAAAGETLSDERREQGHDDWLDAQNRPIRFDPNEWKVPYADAKLYGGQQFERALAEFRAVMQLSKLGDVSLDDVASAAGLNRLNNVPNYGWAAADLAAQKTRESFVPLIEQLTERAVYIVKRLATLSDSIIEAQRVRHIAERSGLLLGGQSAPPVDAADDVYAPEHYPYFTHHVKDLFFKFVDAVAARCKEKCMDEFYSTRTVYWHLSEYGDRKLPTDRAAGAEAHKAVLELATELYDDTRTRIVSNVLLKFYNFFLVPLQTALQTDLQGRITTLSDKSLEQLFHSNEMTARLAQHERRSAERLKRLAEQENKFRAAASRFAHPNVEKAKAAPSAADEGEESDD